MTRWAVLLPLGVGAGFVVLMVGAVLLGKFLGRRAALYPSTSERVQDAPPRAVGRAVVAGDDLAWRVDLARIYADYDTYRNELRLPGEGR